MSPRNLIRAVAALGGLIVLWGSFTLFRGRLNERTGRLPVPELSLDGVERVDVVGPADTVTLTRGTGGWLVNGGTADPTSVPGLVDALADSTLRSELVARNPASHDRMGVGPAGRHLVIRSGGKVVLDLVVGSPGAGTPGTYARLAASDEVYLVQGALGAFVRRDANAWRSRRVAGLRPDDVARIAMLRNGTETVLSRSGPDWRVDDAPADSAAVQRLLRSLSDIAAIGFATPAEADSLDFTTPDRRITVLSAAADTLLDLLVDSTAAGFRARTTGRPDVYHLDFWRVNELTPAPETLRRSSP